jgi:uncharacterized protein YgiM (DUF1202 family)
VKRIATLTTLTTSAALVLGGSLLLAPSAQAYTCTSSYVVTANAVNLRTGPSTSYASKGHLYKNDYVWKIKATTATWWKVELDGKSKTGLKDGTRGYVAKKYLAAGGCFTLD